MHRSLTYNKKMQPSRGDATAGKASAWKCTVCAFHQGKCASKYITVYYRAVYVIPATIRPITC